MTGVFGNILFNHCLIEVVWRPSEACSFIGFVIKNIWMGLGWSSKVTVSVQQVPKHDPLPVIFFEPDPTHLSFENHWVVGNPIFQVNAKFRVLPDITGFPRHDWVLGSPQ